MRCVAPLHLPTNSRRIPAQGFLLVSEVGMGNGGRRMTQQSDQRIEITLRELIAALYRVRGIEERTVPIERIADQTWVALTEESPDATE